MTERGFKNKCSFIERQHTAVTKNSYYEYQEASWETMYIYSEAQVSLLRPQATTIAHIHYSQALLPIFQQYQMYIHQTHQTFLLSFTFDFLRMPFYLIHSSSTQSSYVTSPSNHFQTASKSALSPSFPVTFCGIWVRGCMLWYNYLFIYLSFLLLCKALEGQLYFSICLTSKHKNVCINLCMFLCSHLKCLHISKTWN